MKAKDILVIAPLHFRWDWHNTFERGMVEEFAKQGHTVWVMWDYRFVGLGQILRGERKIKEVISNKVFEVHPVYLIPGLRFKWVMKLNQQWLDFQKKVLWWWLIRFRTKGKFKQIWVWIFTLNRPIKLINPNLKVTYVYDVADGWAMQNKETMALEDQILAVANKVMAGSLVKAALLKSKHPQVYKVPMGFSPPEQKIMLVKLRRQTKPIIGYIGGITPGLDFKLITSLVGRHPEWDFHFYGPVQNEWAGIKKDFSKPWSNLTSHSNFRYFGNFNQKLLFAKIADFSVGIIPYNLNYLVNWFTYPMKLDEYWYCGKPVVATPIMELTLKGRDVLLARSVEEWDEAISRCLRQGIDGKSLIRRRKLALTNQWSGKYKAIKSILG